MPYTRPYSGGFVDYPSTTTPINSTALNTMDVGIKTANDQFQTVTTAQRAALSPTVGQAVWDSDLKQLMVYVNASGGNAWQAVGNTIVCTSTTRPSTPFHGQVIYETDTKKEFRYNGSAWVQTNSTSTTSGVTGVNNLIVPPSVSVYRSSSLTGYTSGTPITWQAEHYTGTDSMWSAGDPTKLTIQTAGIYLVTGVTVLTCSATLTLLDAEILVNGAGAHATVVPVYSTTSAYAAISATFSLSAGTYLQMAAYPAGGSAYAINGNASLLNSQTRFSATWIGRTS